MTRIWACHRWAFPRTIPLQRKALLGEKLFNDMRFSSTGKVSCATCHVPEKAFTDGPLKVSEGIEKLTGTRNAPTVINAAFNKTQFWTAVSRPGRPGAAPFFESRRNGTPES